MKKKIKHHHPLLFSQWFPYLWKFIYKHHDNYYNQEVYGNEEKGYFYKLENGLRFKIFKYDDTKHKVKYAVYIYYHDVFVMNYKTVSYRHSTIVSEHPLCYTSLNDMDYLLDCIKKTIPDNVFSIFKENIKDFEELPTLTFSISTQYEVDNRHFKNFIITHYHDKDDENRFNTICLVKKFNEYYSATRNSYLGFGSNGFFSEAIDSQHFNKIKKMDNYTKSSMFYTLYPLSNPTELRNLSPYKQEIVKNSIGFVIESGHEYYYFMFYNSFISCVNYRGGWMGDHEIVDNKNGLEMTFVTKLTEVMLMLQKRKPSSKFCDYLIELGIEGVNFDKGKGLTDEQWLLYEMMDI